jgi:hypothetical protein
MRRKVDGNKRLKIDRIRRIRRTKIAQQTSRRTPIRNHIQHGPKLCTLSEPPGRHPVKRIEEAGHDVETGAVFGMPAHKVEGRGGEEDTGVADDVGDEEEDVVVVQEAVWGGWSWWCAGGAVTAVCEGGVGRGAFGGPVLGSGGCHVCNCQNTARSGVVAMVMVVLAVVVVGSQYLLLCPRMGR